MKPGFVKETIDKKAVPVCIFDYLKLNYNFYFGGIESVLIASRKAWLSITMKTGMDIITFLRLTNWAGLKLSGKYTFL